MQKSHRSYFSNLRQKIDLSFLTKLSVASLSTCDNKESDLEVAEITASHAEDKLRIKVRFSVAQNDLQLVFAFC